MTTTKRAPTHDGVAAFTGAAAGTVSVFIEPPSPQFMRDGFFDSATNPTGGDDLQAPWRHIRDTFAAAGVPVHTIDLMPERLAAGQRALVISVSGQSDYAAMARQPGVTLSAYLALECPAVEPRIYRRLPSVARSFRRVLSWSDSETLQQFTGRRVAMERFLWPQSYSSVHEPYWGREERGFLVMINSNKLPRLYAHELYTARLRAVQFFHRFGEIDLYGPNWNRMPNRVGKTMVPATARRMWRQVWEAKQRRWPDPRYVAAAGAWKGKAASKADTLSRYLFALCFENQVLKGWMTEKMFDCFFAGTIPVYWGAPDVLEFVPAEAFIDMRQFGDFAELRSHLRGLRPAQIRRHREAGRAFVESARFDPFRVETFTALFRRIVRDDAGVEIPPLGAR